MFSTAIRSGIGLTSPGSPSRSAVSSDLPDGQEFEVVGDPSQLQPTAAATAAAAAEGDGAAAGPSASPAAASGSSAANGSGDGKGTPRNGSES